jgi:hypothetical protein
MNAILKRAALNDPSYSSTRRTEMKTPIRTAATAGLTAGLMIASSAFAIAIPSSRDFGLNAEGAFVDRVVMLTPDTQSVGVYRNQTVKFVDAASGRSFTWRFDTITTGFDLDQIAPGGVAGAGHIKTYVWDNTGRQSG